MKLLLVTVCVLLVSLPYFADSLELDDTEDLDDGEIIDVIEDADDEDIDSNNAEIPEMREDPTTFRRRRRRRTVYPSTFIFGRRRGTARRRSSASNWVPKCPGCVNSGLNPWEIANFSASCLEAHNKLRRLHVDTPDLVWDPELADHALAYAKKLGDSLWVKNNYKLIHDASRGAEGENLWTGTYTGQKYHFGTVVKTESQWRKFTCDQIVHDWYKEIKYWDFSRGLPNLSGETGVTGHFTQVVWQATTKVGMGVYLALHPYHHPTQGMLLLPNVYAVARYLPAANGGTYAYNVGILKVPDCPKKIADGLCQTSGPLWMGFYTGKTLDECQRYCQKNAGCADIVYGTGPHAGKCGMYRAGCVPHAFADVTMYSIAHCSNQATTGDEPYNTSDDAWMEDDKDF